MSGIEFTQYLMPNGRKQQVFIDRPEAVERLALALHDRGVVFEIEMLSDYQTVSMTAELGNAQDDPVIAHELANNGPAVPVAVDRLVRTAAEKLGLAP